MWSYDVCDTFKTPLSSNGTSPLSNQSNSGPGWSFSSAMKPSTDTELYMTTLPTGASSAWDAPQVSVSYAVALVRNQSAGSGQPYSAWPGCSRSTRRPTSTYR